MRFSIACNRRNKNARIYHVMVHIVLFSGERLFTYVAFERRVTGMSESKLRKHIKTYCKKCSILVEIKRQRSQINRLWSAPFMQNLYVFFSNRFICTTADIVNVSSILKDGFTCERDSAYAHAG